MSSDAGRTTKIIWKTADAKAEAEYYALAKGVRLPDLMIFAYYQYQARFKLKPHEIARADKILAGLNGSKLGAVPVQANEDKKGVSDPGRR